MEILNVLVAAMAGFVLGAVWYMVFAQPWLEDTGIPRGPDGKPEGGQDPVLFAKSFVLILIVAGMMRHMFILSGIDTAGKGIVSGAGIGLFLIAPWIALNNLYGARPLRLSMIDGGYATVACALMGLVLVLF